LMGAQPAGVGQGTEAATDEIALDDMRRASFRGQKRSLRREVAHPLLSPGRPPVGGHQPRAQNQNQTHPSGADVGLHRSAVLGRSRGYRASPSTRVRSPLFVSSKYRRAGRPSRCAMASLSHLERTIPSSSSRSSAGYTVPEVRPVASMMSKPNRRPSLRACRMLIVPSPSRLPMCIPKSNIAYVRTRANVHGRTSLHGVGERLDILVVVVDLCTDADPDTAGAGMSLHFKVVVV